MAPAAEGGEEDQGSHGGQEAEGREAEGLLREDQNGSQPVSPGKVSCLFGKIKYFRNCMKEAKKEVPVPYGTSF